MKKRLLSVLLSLCMVLSLLSAVSPMVSAAAPTAVYVGGVNVVGGGYWKSDLAGGITQSGASESDYTVKYDTASHTLTLNNANATKSLTHPSSYDAVISANGDLNLELLGNNVLIGRDRLDSGFGVYHYGGTLTISGDGSLNTSAGTTPYLSYGISADHLVINGATITAAGGIDSGQSTGIHALSSMTITDGTVTATGGIDSSQSFGIRANSMAITDSTVTATGGRTKTTSSDDISAGLFSTGSIEISGGSVTATADNADDYSYGVHAANSVTISGNAVVRATGADATADGGFSYGIAALGSGSPIAISGGSVTAKSGTAPTTRATRNAPNLTGYTGCEWRTSIDDSFSVTPYVWSDSHTYVEFRGFVPVTAITMTNATTVALDTDLTLAATVAPADATNKTVTWSVTDDGDTNAVITDGVFRADTVGTATVTATVQNGAAQDSDYSQTFDITVTDAPAATHTITASAGMGGTITPSGSVTVSDGADQSFAITPASGYLVRDVLVDGASVGAVSSYTFTNVTGNHTIAASFRASGGSGNTGGGTSSGDSTDSTLDSATGIRAQGVTSGSLTISLLTDTATGRANEVVNAVVYSELLRSVGSGHAVIGAYEIKASGYSGNLILTFPVDARHNGKQYVVKHKTTSGTIQTYRGTVLDGKIVISVSELSPFMIAITDQVQIPETGAGGFLTCLYKAIVQSIAFEIGNRKGGRTR